MAKIVADCRNVEDAAAGGAEVAFFVLSRAGVEDDDAFDLVSLRKPADHGAGEWLIGIALRGVDDSHSGARIPFDRRSAREFALGGGEQDGRQIALHAAHERLALRIAEADVELDQLRAIGADHEPCEEYADEWPAFFFHAAQSRQDNALHGEIAHRVRENRRGRVGAHAARVRAFVAIVSAFVILCGDQRDSGLAVAEREETGFLARQKIFDDDALTGRAEFA